jgi:hypothetical protein
VETREAQRSFHQREREMPEEEAVRRTRELYELAVAAGLHEQSRAITVKRHVTPPLLRELPAPGADDVLAAD